MKEIFGIIFIRRNMIEHELSGCDICDVDDHRTDCCPVLQKGVKVEDAQCPSRTVLTLPSNLRIKFIRRQQVLSDGSSLQQINKSKLIVRGIQVRENIATNTRFGPFEAPTISDSNAMVTTIASAIEFPLKIFGVDGNWKLLDTSDEDKCNWMSLVRPAQNRNDHNVIALQLLDEIFFITKRDIRIHEELRVWYGRNYGRMMGIDRLSSPTPDPDGNELLISRKRTKKLALTSALNNDDSLPRRTHRRRATKVWKEYIDESSIREEENDSDYDDNNDEDYKPATLLVTDEKVPVIETDKQKSKNQQCPFCARQFSSARFLHNHEFQCHRHQMEVTEQREEANATELITSAQILVKAMQETDINPFEFQICSSDNTVAIKKTRTSLTTCNLCEKKFKSRGLFKRHQTKNKVCVDCGNSYCTYKGLRQHVCSSRQLTNNQDDLFVCNICHKTFTQQKYLDRHRPIHSGDHACPICSKWLRSRESLQNHMRICGQMKELEDNGSAQCPHCKINFNDIRDFRRHLYEHTYQFPCDNCGARFRNKVTFDCHRCAVTGDTDITKTLFKETETEIESKIGDGQKKEQTDKLEPFVCDVCGSLFSSTSSLKVHRRLHGEKLFECEVCGTRFHRKDMLADHRAKHGDPSIPCQICQKHFKTKKSLDVHNLLHDGQKRFSCQTCGKQFYQRGNLVKHEEVHNEERKQYSCPTCKKDFSTKEYLAIHVLEHSKGRQFQCKLCGKSFIKEHQLKSHQRTFHTDLIYVCKFCNRRIKLKNSLRRHLKKKHSDQRDLWNSLEDFNDMQLSLGSSETTEKYIETSDQIIEENPQIENSTSTTMNEVQVDGDGESMFVTVTGIQSKALQQALASGSVSIRPGATPNTIEISLPIENPIIQEVITGTEYVHEHEEMVIEDTVTKENVTVVDDEIVNEIEFSEGTIVLKDGTLQRISADGSDILLYLLTSDEQKSPNADQEDEMDDPQCAIPLNHDPNL